MTNFDRIVFSIMGVTILGRIRDRSDLAIIVFIFLISGLWIFGAWSWKNFEDSNHAKD